MRRARRGNRTVRLLPVCIVLDGSRLSVTMSNNGHTTMNPNPVQTLGTNRNGGTTPPAQTSRFPSLDDEYTKAELHNGIVMFADIREFSSYMDSNSDYRISLLAALLVAIDRGQRRGSLHPVRQGAR